MKLKKCKRCGVEIAGKNFIIEKETLKKICPVCGKTQ
jgi:rRNA maturation protein Nop10